MRRENRIRTIYSSLAIEQNTLSIEQVTAVINGKTVLAPPKDIAEVQNAYEIYENMDILNPYSVDDLLKAHKVLTKGTVSESGKFRTRPVSVVDNDGNILHFGTLPRYVPDSIYQLLDWVKNSDIHMIIKSCVFHYEFELIHPFANGNGRIGRLWHTLLLSKWNPIFAWLPIESIIHNHQSGYYDAIHKSNEEGKSTRFIEFMLSIIKETLVEATNNIPTKNKSDMRFNIIKNYLNEHDNIMNSDVQRLLNVSAPTASRILAQLTKEGKLKRIRNGSYWGYIINQ